MRITNPHERVNRKNYKLIETLSRFYYEEFKKVRENFVNEPVIYPNAYYELVYKAIGELAIKPDPKNATIEVRTAGSIWLLGEMSNHEISDITYSWIWRNLSLAIKYEADDMVLYHWQTANQYITYNLGYILPKYDRSSGVRVIINEEQVKKRKQERDHFFEFHNALGGLLLYSRRYNCLRRIFSHTNSEPPRYDLLPSSMDEIFKFYYLVRNPYDENYSWISQRYPFPKLSGLNADSVIKKWISSYMALLFLRQYTIIPYLTIMKPLEYPPIPKTQEEIKEWIDGLDFFKKLVLEHLSNRNLLEELNLAFINPDWCRENNKAYPTDFIEDFKAQLQNAYNIKALTLPLSSEKIAQFDSSTKQILEETLSNFSPLNNSNPIRDDSDKWFVNGERMLQSKDAFSENPEVHHIDFDSFLASVLSRKINDGVSSTFLFKKTKSYLLKSDDIFPAIDRLNIDEQFIIICFGVNLEHFIDQLKVQKLTTDKYQNIQLLTYSGSRLVDSSFFILKRDDLPKISTIKITPEIIEKYSLNKISNTLELYTSVIDLNNTSSEVFEENRQDKEEDELRKSVLLSIIMSVEIRWKKGIEMIQIIQYDEYSQKGLINSLNEIKPIKRGKPSR